MQKKKKKISIRTKSNFNETDLLMNSDHTNHFKNNAIWWFIAAKMISTIKKLLFRIYSNKKLLKILESSYENWIRFIGGILIFFQRSNVWTSLTCIFDEKIILIFLSFFLKKENTNCLSNHWIQITQNGSNRFNDENCDQH